MTLRLLPGSAEGGRPAYLSAKCGPSFVTRVADDLESARLETAGEVLSRAEAAAWNRRPAGSETELAALVESLCAALRDMIRIAESRGIRQTAPDDTGAVGPFGEGGLAESHEVGGGAGAVDESGGVVARRWPAEPQYVGRARELLSVHLKAWGMAELADTAVLVLSELHGNAVRHACLPDEG